MSKCRLCLAVDCPSFDIADLREGLPISVLIMIFCPVKIEANDPLPKQICNKCVNILMSAYQLRDESLQTDRYLREVSEINRILAEEVSKPQETVFIKAESQYEIETPEDETLPRDRKSVV